MSVKVLTHVLLPIQENDDHGPWRSGEAETEIEAWLARGYRVATSTVTAITTPWGRHLTSLNDVRLVLVNTLVD